MPCVEHLNESAACDKELTRLGIQAQPVRASGATGWIPGGNRLSRLQINCEAAVLIFQIRVEAAVHSVHGKALGGAIVSKLFFLLHRLAIDYADGFVARDGHPDFLR